MNSSHKNMNNTKEIPPMPQLDIPLTEQETAKLKAVGQLQPETVYIPKSEKMDFLKKEREMTEELMKIYKVPIVPGKIPEPLPSDPTSIEEFISSMRIGIGQMRARQMVNLTGGEDFWTTLFDNPELFLEVSGITRITIEKVRRNIERMGYREEMFRFYAGDVQLINLGVPCFSANYLDIDRICKMQMQKEETYKCVGDQLCEWRGSYLKARYTLRDSVFAVCRTLQDHHAGVVQNLKIEEKGNTGEDIVEGFLVRNLDYPVLSGVILPGAERDGSTPRTAETDLLLITPKGIYVCEVKNYGKAGQTLEVRSDGHIIKKDYYGNVLDDMGSPLKQNRRHCDAVKKLILDANAPQMPVYSVVLIANTDVAVENNSNSLVLNMYQLVDEVRRENGDEQFSSEQINKVFAAIQKHRMGERSFPVSSLCNHYEELVEASEIVKHAGNMMEPQRVKDASSKLDMWARRVLTFWEKENPNDYRKIKKLVDKRNRLQNSGALWIFAPICTMIATIVLSVKCFENSDLHFPRGIFSFFLSVLPALGAFFSVQAEEEILGRADWYRYPEDYEKVLRSNSIQKKYFVWFILCIAIAFFAASRPH